MVIAFYVARVDSEEPVRRGTRIIGHTRVSRYVICFYDGASHEVVKLRFEDGIYRGGDIERLRVILRGSVERGDKIIYYGSNQLSLLMEALKGLPKTFTLISQAMERGLLEDITKEQVLATWIPAPGIVAVRKRDEVEIVEKNVEGGCIGASRIVYELYTKTTREATEGS